MKLRISEDVVGNGRTPSLMEIDRIFINNGYKPISPATPDFQFNYNFDGRNFRFRTPKEAWDFIALNDLVDDRSHKESKKRRSVGKNLKEATYKYRLVDSETDEIIDTFADENSAEEYARQYIRNWATDDDPVYVDCYRIDDEDAQTEYPKYLEDDEYMWTLDSLNGDWWK